MTSNPHPHSVLFDSLRLGPVSLENRVSLARMTRVSGTFAGEATDTIAAYHERFARGGFGLLITEGIYTDAAFSQGYHHQPGLALPEQTRSWRRVVERVHASGARIFAQLMHAGSQSQGNRFEESTMAPSATRPKGEQLGMYRGTGQYRVPSPMTTGQIDKAIKGFAAAAPSPRTWPRTRWEPADSCVATMSAGGRLLGS